MFIHTLASLDMFAIKLNSFVHDNASDALKSFWWKLHEDVRDVRGCIKALDEDCNGVNTFKYDMQYKTTPQYHIVNRL